MSGSGSILPAFAVLLAAATFAAAGTQRTLAFHPVRLIAEAPVLDGRLDDACWEDAPVSSTHYVYWNPDPDLAQIRNDLRLVYGERGVYAAVVNHEQKMDQLRATRTTRDDPALWKDDSIGLDFDPAANGVGYVHFTVSCLGAKRDYRRIDAAVTDEEWSGEQWQAAIGKTDAAWTVEAFFPWSELGKTASPGDVWMFNQIRFAFTTGKLVGSSWSPGGSYAAPDRFGYLLFEGAAGADAGDALRPAQVGERLAALATPPWNLPMGSVVVSCPAPGQVQVLNPADLLAEQQRSLRQAERRAREAVKQSGQAQASQALTKLLAAAPPVADQPGPAEALVAVKAMARTEAELNEIYWQAQVNRLLSQSTELME